MGKFLSLHGRLSNVICSDHFRKTAMVKTLTGIYRLKKGTVPNILQISQGVVVTDREKRLLKRQKNFKRKELEQSELFVSTSKKSHLIFVKNFFMLL